MTNELSFVELEAELATELPTRSLMHHHRKHHKHVHHSNGVSASAKADHGSVANANATKQVIINTQIAINIGGGAIYQNAYNTNNNTTWQSGTPVNVHL